MNRRRRISAQIAGCKGCLLIIMQEISEKNANPGGHPQQPPQGRKARPRDAAQSAFAGRAAARRFPGGYRPLPARWNKNGEKAPFCGIFRRFSIAFGGFSGINFRRDSLRNQPKSNE